MAKGEKREVEKNAIDFVVPADEESAEVLDELVIIDDKEKQELQETIEKQGKIIEEYQRENHELNVELKELQAGLDEREEIVFETPRDECKIDEIMDELNKCQSSCVNFHRTYDRIRQLVK